MKIICTNVQDCGLVEPYQAEDLAEFCVTCPNCGQIAFIYTDSQKCIYKKDYINPDLEKIILEGIIKIQQNERKNEPKEE